MRKGRLFVVSGPSGAGKSTVLRALLERRKNLQFSVSATTRPPREGEEDGVHYYFLSVDTFREWIEQDAFLEHAAYVGNFYGTPRKYVEEALDQGNDVVLDIEVQGAAQVRQREPEAVHIFIAPPSWEELERRLRSRGTDTPERIQERLSRARVEFVSARAYDYLVVNDALDTAVEELDAIMTAEHCRPGERMEILSE